MSARQPLDLTPSAIAALLQALPTMPVAEKAELLADLELLEQKTKFKRARDSFLEFCRAVYAEWKEGPHHRHLAPKLHDVALGTKTRMSVSMPPRFGKSESIAFLFVAWYLGHHPSHHIMMVTHTASLSADFGRKVRNLIDSPVYQNIFPDTKVSRDKTASDNWTTTMGGKYLAIGIGANVAGHGAHLLICDDLVSEQVMLTSSPDAAFATAWEYVQVGPLQRLMPNGRIVMIATRWGKKDPIGRALAWAQNNPESPQWDEVRFPAIINGKSLWPEQWPLEQLLAKKASMFPQFWAAQYMQEPTSEEGAIIKRDWWRIWEADDPPKCEYIMISIDTAHDTKSSSDYTAVTTWGVWSDERRDYKPQLILLDAFKDRMEFPELKKVVLKHYKNWEPDAVIIEKKAAGAPLIQEMRSIGVPVQEFSPSRGNDKRVRLNAIADLFSSGIVWVPDTRWAREVMDEVAEFPNGEHDDFCDCTSQALLRFRQGGFVTLDTDDTGDDKLRLPQSRAYYRI